MTVSFADTAMVGSLGASSTAGVSVVSSSIWLINGILSGVGVGYSVQVANAVGAEDHALARKVIRQGALAVAVLGILALAVMLALPPTGMFAEPAHFEKPEYSEDLAKTIAEYLIPDPDAQNPLTNTVRLDVNTLQAMEQIPPEFGLQYGWFTTESTGKSRWILTDHLKCAVSGYERLTDMNGYKVYRLIEPYEE